MYGQRPRKFAFCSRFPAAKAQKSDSDLDVKQLVEQIVQGKTYKNVACSSFAHLHVLVMPAAAVVYFLTGVLLLGVYAFLNSFITLHAYTVFTSRINGTMPVGMEHH